MATENFTLSSDLQSSLSKLSDKLHGQMDKFCNVDALLSCAENSLLDKDGDSENVRRVICIARKILADIRDQVDGASLEASHTQG